MFLTLMNIFSCLCICLRCVFCINSEFFRQEKRMDEILNFQIIDIVLIKIFGSLR